MGIDQEQFLSGSADKARRLFLYLRDLSELRSPSVRDLEDYEQVLWISDLPGDADAWCLFDDDRPDVQPDSWLEMRKVVLPPRPQIDPRLADWISISSLDDYESDGPDWTDKAYEVVLPDGLEGLHRDYAEKSWRPWAARTKRLKPSYDFYRSLFSISERRQRLGEVYELVLGVGCLTWRRGGQPVRRHMVTTPVEITVDGNTGSITLTPSEAEGRNRFELDMLEPDERGAPEALRPIVDEIESADPFSLHSIVPQVLRRWMNQAHPDGVVSDGLARPSIGSRPEVALAPAIILRKRGQRTVVQLLNDIAIRIASGDSIPAGVERLVSTEKAVSLDGSGGLTDPEIYFPLPANDEQRRIVQRMSRDHGLLVQGPPGTGKSHTIANLISHLLAQGQRVLVTAHTERALRVLHDKLPDEIKPLCISLLGNDRDSIRSLEEAVGEISSRKADWSKEDSEKELDRLRKQLGTVRSRKQQTLNELRQIRESETLPISLGPYTGTRQQIATQLSASRERLGWIPGTVSDERPPLNDGEFRELVALFRDLSPTAGEFSLAHLPDPVVLPSGPDFESLVRHEAALEQNYAAALARLGVWSEGLAAASLADLHGARDSVLTVADRLGETLSGWVADARSDVVAGRAEVWRVLAAEIGPLHEEASEALASVGSVPVTIPTERNRLEMIAAFEELARHVEAGGRIRIGPFSAGVVRRHRDLVQATMVNGAPPTAANALKLAATYTSLLNCLDRLEQVWGGRVKALSGASPAQQIAGYANEKTQLDSILELQQELASARLALVQLPGIRKPDWADVDQLRTLAQALQAESDHRETIQIRQRLQSIQDAVGDCAHDAVVRLRESLDARDPEQYREAMGALDAARRLAVSADRRSDLSKQLEGGSPSLLEAVAMSSVRPGSDLGEAWAWRLADEALQALVEPGRAHRLSQELEGLETSERACLAGLAAGLAWQRMFLNLKSEPEMALQAWAVAVRKIGRGTGKYAATNRQTARDYMGMAREAIPAWIMPIYRVAESSAVQAGSFDVIIVDEASQASVESLFLFYLGKQIVIVGDDQQIAPQAVGLSLEEVDALRRQLISDVPFSEQFGPTNSLFDQAKVRFPGLIPLKEHFRCMPEIIEFSNRISYRQNALVPLRQFGVDRLDPIKTVYLEHGFREGATAAINRPEAEEIVQRILKMYSDPAYDGKTIGVISLQGEAQARLIESMLVDRLGPQQMLERAIVCGDAYAFQGDERDVILLSMVAATNQRFAALADEPAKRRFNVAGSRARDQIWLIHSVRLEELGQTDMRRALLEYYLDPEVEHLRSIGEFDRSILNPPFESRFEQDVFLALRERGYRVAPQVKVAGYRIDLVVEGAAGRLAVECDGDEWHGADQWESDAARQRVLERCGWRFVRVMGSEFYRNRSTALDPLWATLERLGIEPGGYSAFDRWQIVESPISGPALSTDLDIPDLPDASNDTEELDDIASGRAVGMPEGPPPDVIIRESSKVGDSVADGGPVELDSGVRLGSTVTHRRLGSGRITAVVRSEATDDWAQPYVRVRFEDGREYDYTREEFDRAGFATLGPTAGALLGERATSGDVVAPQPLSAFPVSPSVAMPGAGPQAYEVWNERGAPDPRDGDPSIRDWMLRVVSCEGPVTSDRAYSLLVRSSGAVRVTGPVRSALNKTLHRMHNALSVTEFSSPATAWPQRVLSIPGEPLVRVRERGPRDLREIPLNEVATVMAALLERRPLSSSESLMRDTLEHYELVKLTDKTREYLNVALALARRFHQ